MASIKRNKREKTAQEVAGIILLRQYVFKALELSKDGFITSDNVRDLAEKNEALNKDFISQFIAGVIRSLTASRALIRKPNEFRYSKRASGRPLPLYSKGDNSKRSNRPDAVVWRKS